jgi:hypothetical protein
VRIDTLLRLYPRAWRERYQEEFVAMVGSRPVSAQQVIDIVSGAIDAWLSADVRRASQALGPIPTGARAMTLKSMMVCDQSKLRMTTRDGMIGAAVMLAGSAAGSLLGIAARRAGWTLTADVLLNLAFPGSMMLSMPFWLMKGQPWKAQAAVIGTTLALLMLITIGASAL